MQLCALAHPATSRAVANTSRVQRHRPRVAVRALPLPWVPIDAALPPATELVRVQEQQHASRFLNPSFELAASDYADSRKLLDRRGQVNDAYNKVAAKADKKGADKDTADEDGSDRYNLDGRYNPSFELASDYDDSRQLLDRRDQVNDAVDDVAGKANKSGADRYNPDRRYNDVINGRWSSTRK